MVKVGKVLNVVSPYTAQKVKFPVKDFFSKCDQIRSFPRILVTFTEEILNGKLHFLCSDKTCKSFFLAQEIPDLSLFKLDYTLISCEKSENIYRQF